MVAKTSATRRGAKAHAGLVEEEDVGVQHEGAGHCEHLLLAAREGAGELFAAFGEAGEDGEHAVEVGLHVALRAGAGEAGEGAHQEIVGDREGGEDPAALGGVGEAQGA